MVKGKYESTRKRWIQVQAIGQDFWECWLSEYLLQLTNRFKWEANGPLISFGDVGILKRKKCTAK